MFGPDGRLYLGSLQKMCYALSLNMNSDIAGNVCLKYTRGGEP